MARNTQLVIMALIGLAMVLSSKSSTTSYGVSPGTPSPRSRVTPRPTPTREAVTIDERRAYYGSAYGTGPGQFT